jgi:hypothetical protein
MDRHRRAVGGSARFKARRPQRSRSQLRDELFAKHVLEALMLKPLPAKINVARIDARRRVFGTPPGRRAKS